MPQAAGNPSAMLSRVQGHSLETGQAVLHSGEFEAGCAASREPNSLLTFQMSRATHEY